MKILAIGNSFSEDATYYLHKIAASAGVDVTVVNLYIGGCTLEQHARNIRENNAAYRYERNGLYTQRLVSVEEVLHEEAWDIVTVQQQSGRCGLYESYGADFKAVLDYVRAHAPQAQLWFHETWAYEHDSGHGDFDFYGDDQQAMHSAIVAATRRVCRENGALPIIPSGSVIDAVRKLPPFDYTNGGLSLCRDGFHMTVVYGRYLLGLVWFKTLLGGRMEDVTFVPTPADLVNGYVPDVFECDPEKLALLKETLIKSSAAPGSSFAPDL